MFTATLYHTDLVCVLFAPPSLHSILFLKFLRFSCFLAECHKIEVDEIIFSGLGPLQILTHCSTYLPDK